MDAGEKSGHATLASLKFGYKPRLWPLQRRSKREIIGNIIELIPSLNVCIRGQP